MYTAWGADRKDAVLHRLSTRGLQKLSAAVFFRTEDFTKKDFLSAKKEEWKQMLNDGSSSNRLANIQGQSWNRKHNKTVTKFPITNSGWF
jgi:hypothetical protein